MDVHLHCFILLLYVTKPQIYMSTVCMLLQWQPMNSLALTISTIVYIHSPC